MLPGHPLSQSLRASLKHPARTSALVDVVVAGVVVGGVIVDDVVVVVAVVVDALALS